MHPVQKGELCLCALQLRGGYCRIKVTRETTAAQPLQERKAPMNILESVLDSSSHAIFTLDREGIVTHINRQAKESFGLFNHSQQSHAAGRLEPGDLVILATSVMAGRSECTGHPGPEDPAR